LSDGEISYQCSLKTCPLCKVVTEDTTSVCDCGFNFRTDLSESDYKLLRRAYQVEIRTFKTQVKLKLHFEKSKEDFTSALDKDIDKLSHVTWTLRGNLCKNTIPIQTMPYERVQRCYVSRFRSFRMYSVWLSNRRLQL